MSNGGFLFAMCGATETLELAIAAQKVDIASVFADGTPIDEHADEKLDWSRTFAFRDAHIEPSPYVSSMSDIDGHQANVPGRRQPLGTFTLFGFSAKFDPVASMLVQDHRSVIPDFYGVTTSFMRRTLKPGVTILAEEPGAPWVKYIHGDYGKGSWTFLGGHDPEDPQHAIGNPPTDLSLHRELARLSADPEQRPLPGGEEEAAQDVSTPLTAREPSARYDRREWRRRGASRAVGGGRDAHGDPARGRTRGVLRRDGR